MRPRPAEALSLLLTVPVLSAAVIDTGYISQNVYLFCASEGLATVARAWMDKPLLEKKMGLPPHKQVVLAQTVGYPED